MGTTVSFEAFCLCAKLQGVALQKSEGELESCLVSQSVKLLIGADMDF
jgi:hypothetical protein